MAVVECSKTWQLLATHTAMVFDSDRGCTVIFWGFRRFEPVKCYLPQRQFTPSPALDRKRLFLCHSQKCYRDYLLSNMHLPLPLSAPRKSHMFVQIECFSDITQNYWNGLHKQESGKNWREMHQLQFLSVFHQKHCSVSLMSNMAAALPVGKQGVVE